MLKLVGGPISSRLLASASVVYSSRNAAEETPEITSLISAAGDREFDLDDYSSTRSRRQDLNQ